MRGVGRSRQPDQTLQSLNMDGVTEVIPGEGDAFVGLLPVCGQVSIELLNRVANLCRCDVDTGVAEQCLKVVRENNHGTR
jgi:hypothetical protein